MTQETIEIAKPVPFPQALFKIREYDGAKVFIAIIFILSCIYFITGLLTFFNWTNAWWRPDFAVKLMYLGYHLSVFTIVFCLAWLVFDRRGIEGYLLSIFSFVIGLVYIVSPIDFVPEVLPIVGSMDDAVVGSGSMILGVTSWVKNKQKRVTSKEIAELIDCKKYKAALECFLKNEGYKIQRTIS